MKLYTIVYSNFASMLSPNQRILIYIPPTHTKKANVRPTYHSGSSLCGRRCRGHGGLHRLRHRRRRGGARATAAADRRQQRRVRAQLGAEALTKRLQLLPHGSVRSAAEGRQPRVAVLLRVAGQMLPLA